MNTSLFPPNFRTVNCKQTIREFKHIQNKRQVYEFHYHKHRIVKSRKIQMKENITSNLLEMQKHRSHMTHSWHVGVVKAHIHQNGDPYNDRHSAIPKENSYHCTANQVTCGRRHILDYSSDPPVSHFALEEVQKKFRRLILLRN